MRKIPWRKKWLSTPVFWPGKFHGQRTWQATVRGVAKSKTRFSKETTILKLYRAQDGRKEFAGHLAAYDEASGDVTVTVGKEEMTFVKKDVALVRLRVEF